MRGRNPAELDGMLLGGRYRVGAAFARGGMGSVYEARDERIGRAVAVKVLLPDLAKENVYIERFRREAAASAALAHPNIATTTDYGIDPEGGLCYLVMERVDGPPLSTVLSQSGPMAPERVVAIGQQVCSALEAAHGAGIVHRDLKPGNVLLVTLGDGKELVKLVDFGIAQLKASRAYVRLTATGALLGTPAFMAPEQALGETVDGRADIYSLGVILYGCLSGRKPFDGADTATIVRQILGGTHTPLESLRPDAPYALCSTIETAMARDREKRFATARAFGDALARSIVGKPASTPPPAKRAHVPVPASPFVAPTATIPAPEAEEDLRTLAVPPPVGAQPAKSGKKVFLWVAVAVIALALAGGIGFGVEAMLRNRSAERDEAPRPTAPVVLVGAQDATPQTDDGESPFKIEDAAAATADAGPTTTTDAGAAILVAPPPGQDVDAGRRHHHHHDASVEGEAGGGDAPGPVPDIFNRPPPDPTPPPADPAPAPTGPVVTETHHPGGWEGVSVDLRRQ